MGASRVPGYLRHKGTGQARTVLNGRTYYLGRYGSKASRQHYARLIAEWEASDRALGLQPTSSTDDYTVADLIADYLAYAATYYLRDGKPTKEVVNIRYALRPVLTLYGGTAAAKFGPRNLKAVRQAMVTDGLSRNLVNQRVGIIKRMFRWATSEELVPPSVFQGLSSVEGLRRGRSGAKEFDRVQPVPEKHIEAVLPRLPETIRAMVEVQLLTGCRPCEVTIIRACDMEMSGSVWLYRPGKHKNDWRGKDRIIYIGTRAQLIIRSFLRPGLQDRYLFSPSESEQERWRQQREARTTPLWPSHRERKKRIAATRRRRKLRDRYSTDTYSRAIRRACERAGVPDWSPGRLRHNAATNFRRIYGLEVAKALLGHSRVETSQIYAAVDEGTAIRAMAEIG